jgi:serine/threonine protein phosphatase PrpC
MDPQRLAEQADRRCGAGQIQGGRRRQEDEYGIRALSAEDASNVLLVVADGMGGHAGGAEAAHAAVTAFLDNFEGDGGPAEERLKHALARANDAVRALKRETAGLEDAGSTLLGVLMEGGKLSWISVGDSSLSLLRAGRLERLNADHSMRPVLRDLVAGGRLTAEAADAHANKSALRSAVTGEEIELVDIRCGVALEPADQLLLASDGLETLAPTSVKELLERGRDLSPRGAVADLLAAVEREGVRNQDNTTAILYRAGPLPENDLRSKGLSQVLSSLGLGMAVGAAVIVVGFVVWWLLAGGGRGAFHLPAQAGERHGAQSSAKHPQPR